MTKTNILIVEDELLIAKDIENSLIKLGYNVVGICSTGEDALKKVKKLPDLILMDIMLKGKMNGIEAADIIKTQFDIPVIFLTAYADENTLDKAKITEPYGYIIKPFKEIDLHTNIEIALYKHEKELEIKRERDMLYSLVDDKQSHESIYIKSRSRLLKIKIEDIYFVEALKDYVIINTPQGRFTIHSTMKHIHEKLPEKYFVRVHRSFIVRLDKIAAIEQQSLTLENEKLPAHRKDKQIPIGGCYKDILLKRLNLI